MLRFRLTKRFFALLTLAVLTVTATAQRVAPPSRSADAFSPKRIKTEVTYLASDALQGRGSGEPGNEKAAQYVASEFRRDGLKPLGTAKERDTNAPTDGSGYFQPFRFSAGRRLEKGSLFTVTLPLADHGRGASTATVTFGSPGYQVSGISGAGDVRGPIVFVGYGIHAPQAGHDDYAEVDVKGKIALMLAGSPSAPTQSRLMEFADVRRKALTARELGALAVLVIVPKGADLTQRPRFDFAEASGAGLPVLRVSIDLAQGLLLPSARAFEQSQSDADQGKSVSQATETTAHIVAPVRAVEKTSANVVGLLEGSDPVLKNEYVVVGAHLDHLGLGGPGSLAKSSAPAIHHGADDNASGTAGVMELARYAAAHRAEFKRSVVFVCFSGEELGLLGSDHFVKHPPVPLEKTAAMLNMDMIGRLRDDKILIVGSGTAKEWDALLDDSSRNSGLTLVKSESGFGASDQQSFYTHNVPVLFFFTGSHTDYHTPTDTADKINASGEAKVLRLTLACLERVANAESRPTFRRIQTTAQEGGRRGFRVYFGSVPDYAATVEGVQLSGVREGSPAEKAGLKAGDIIIKFGDKTVKSVGDYALALQDYKPGDTVTVTIRRGDKTLMLPVTLIAHPE